jgi:hypothetical protein
MPKTEIDYSNTIIYKITCKDPIVTDVYVGHTTNFVQRKHAHKQSCINDKSPNYKCKLYEVIRNNGGWINWKMEIINFFECHDHYEARKKEQEYFISLNATLNSIEPMPKPKPKEIVIKPEVIKETFFCELTENEEYASKYVCTVCNYKTSRKSSIDKHNLSTRHINRMVLNAVEQKIAQKIFVCKLCNKEYKARNSLWYHEQKCIEILPENVVVSDSSNNGVIQVMLKENFDFKSMLMDMMKSNTDLQKQMIEICKKINN